MPHTSSLGGADDGCCVGLDLDNNTCSLAPFTSLTRPCAAIWGGLSKIIAGEVDRLTCSKTTLRADALIDKFSQAAGAKAAEAVKIDGKDEPIACLAQG